MPGAEARDLHAAAVLERVRLAYEGHGYIFEGDPRDETLPPFLDGHRPDALATKGNEHVVIKVAPAGPGAPTQSLSDLRRRLNGQEGWRLDVVYGRREEGPRIPAPSRDLIEEELRSVTELTRSGHSRAAFLLSWSLLEAALKRLDDGTRPGGMQPAEIVQSLASLGYLDGPDERTMMRLRDLRNRVAHGDLSAKVSSEDVARMLETVQRLSGDR